MEQKDVEREEKLGGTVDTEKQSTKQQQFRLQKLWAFNQI